MENLKAKFKAKFKEFEISQKGKKKCKVKANQMKLIGINSKYIQITANSSKLTQLKANQSKLMQILRRIQRASLSANIREVTDLF